MKNLNDRFGFIVRAYAEDKDLVEGVVSRAMNTIRQIHQVVGDDVNILIMIPKDHDCGLTEDVLNSTLTSIDFKVQVMSVSGYHSCEVLNVAVARLVQLDIDISIILSNKAVKYITHDTLVSIGEAFDVGAKVVGVAISELKEGICNGFVQNTFIAWNSYELQAVGGFDSKIDVEEVAPSVRLIKKFGKCIAVLVPPSQDFVIRTSEDGQVRHLEVTKNKLKNQLIELQRLGVESDFVTSGILDDYPHVI